MSFRGVSTIRCGLINTGLRSDTRGLFSKEWHKKDERGACELAAATGPSRGTGWERERGKGLWEPAGHRMPAQSPPTGRACPGTTVLSPLSQGQQDAFLQQVETKTRGPVTGLTVRTGSRGPRSRHVLDSTKGLLQAPSHLPKPLSCFCLPKSYPYCTYDGTPHSTYRHSV